MNGNEQRSQSPGRCLGLCEQDASIGRRADEKGRHGMESGSTSVRPPLPGARFRRGGAGGPELGTDLCDTHASRRITHSSAHNVLLPLPDLFNSLATIFITNQYFVGQPLGYVSRTSQ